MNPKGLVPPNPITQPDEDEMENIIDLDEILREMGYGDDEDTDDLSVLDRSSLKDLIKQEISNYFENEPQDEVDINEIIETLTYTGFYK